MSRFEQEYMGRGPKDVHAHLIDDLVIVRLKGVLTAADHGGHDTGDPFGPDSTIESMPMGDLILIDL